MSSPIKQHLQINDLFWVDRALGDHDGVYHAIDKSSGQHVALKVFDKQTVHLPHLRQEVLVLQLFRHPHILQFYDFIETVDHYLLVTEYINGCEFFDYLLEFAPLSRENVINFLHQLVMGILHFHTIGIAHRDLKPENVMIDKHSKKLTIIDFGFATYSSDGWVSNSCGSPHYASPEAYDGETKKYNGYLSDVWSLGVISYIMVTGGLPFIAESARSLSQKIKNGELKFPSEESKPLDPDLVDLITKMLEKDVKKRIELKDVLKHPVFKDYVAPTIVLSPVCEMKNVKNEILDTEILDDIAFLLGRNAKIIGYEMKNKSEHVQLYQIMSEKRKGRQTMKNIVRKMSKREDFKKFELLSFLLKCLRI